MAQLEILAQLGEDALANHFTVVIPAIDKLGASVASLNMRVLTIEIPERTIGNYEITKRGRKMTRPSGVSEQSTEVSFTFRCDKYFLGYKGLINWMNFIQNNRTMAMASDSGVMGLGGASQFRHDVSVWAISSLDDGVPNTIWTLEGAYPTSVSSISFDETSGDPIECDVTLNCMNIVYPEM